jgi:hypothetical protein
VLVSQGAAFFLAPLWLWMTATPDGHPGAVLLNYFSSSILKVKVVSENQQFENNFKPSVYTGGAAGVAKHLTAKGHIGYKPEVLWSKFSG